MSNFQIRMSFLIAAIILLIVGNIQEPTNAVQPISAAGLMKLAGSLIIICLLSLWAINKLEKLKVR